MVIEVNEKRKSKVGVCPALDFFLFFRVFILGGLSIKKEQSEHRERI
jgi:hypothetical protein